MSDLELKLAIKLGTYVHRARINCLDSIEDKDILKALYYYNEINNLRKEVDEDYSGPVIREFIYYIDIILFELSTGTEFN